MASVLKRVGHTGITVANLERSLAFWVGALGFELEFHIDVTGPLAEVVTGVPGAHIDLAMVRGGGHSIELLHYVTPDDRQTFRPRSCDVGSWHIAFLVDDLDAILAAMSEHGFAPLSSPVEIAMGPRAGGKAVYTRDPDGTTIELIQPPPNASVPAT